MVHARAPVAGQQSAPFTGSQAFLSSHPALVGNTPHSLQAWPVYATQHAADDLGRRKGKPASDMQRIEDVGYAPVATYAERCLLCNHEQLAALPLSIPMLTHMLCEKNGRIIWALTPAAVLRRLLVRMHHSAQAGRPSIAASLQSQMQCRKRSLTRCYITKLILQSCSVLFTPAHSITVLIVICAAV